MKSNDQTAAPGKSLPTMGDLLGASSKHSLYQELHPKLLPLLGVEYRPLGKAESARWQYMQSATSFEGKSVIDIGANTGFFTFSAILDGGASSVLAYEGNPSHAEFIERGASMLGLKDTIVVSNSYFEFSSPVGEAYDMALCLNVLHHLGDDFGNQHAAMIDAKEQIIHALNSMASQCHRMWLQLGYNWKGNRDLPLFRNGLKSEVIEFISEGTRSYWAIDSIAIYNPEHGQYHPSSDSLLARFESIGEFLNRPLFLLRSQRLDEQILC